MRIAILALATVMVCDAQADQDTERLVQGCREMVGIYAKREQMRMAAGLTTSLSEALRAGYCQGVIEQFRRDRDEVCTALDWFEQAQRIAGQPRDIAQQASVNELLEQSCEN